MADYEVIVSNVGTVYSGTDKNQAKSTYDEYVAISKSGKGRAGKEEVTLMEDGEPWLSYFPIGLGRRPKIVQ